MVSLIKEDKTLELTSLTYTLKGRIGGYLSDNIDRSNMKLYILPNTKALFGVTISKTALSSKLLYKVELDSKTTLKEEDIDLEKLYKNIDEFYIENPNSSRFIIDEKYNIFGVANDKNDYLPYKLDRIGLIEANVNNCVSIVSTVQTKEDEYFIFSFPDMIFTVDKYTTLNLISVLVKYYVESRFPVSDKKKLEKSQIISFPVFQFLTFHLKSLLRATCTTQYSIKNYFDNMSRMNLLPHIPTENWWIEQNELKLNSNRLIEFMSKKESLIDKVKNNIIPNNTEEKEEEKEDEEETTETEILDVPYIPEYYSDAFMEDDIMIMSWGDFLLDFTKFETNYHGKIAYDYDIFMCPVIIIPDDTIMNLKKEDVIFLGFDGEKFYLTLATKENPNVITDEQINLKNTLKGYFWRKFGYETEIVYEDGWDDEDKYRNCNLSLLEDYPVGE